MPDDYVCDLCGVTFLSSDRGEVFCPHCGSSQVKKEVGFNELSDEDVYVGILHGREKTDFLC